MERRDCAPGGLASWHLPLAVVGLALAPQLSASDFIRDLKPVLETKCLSCHNPNNIKGKLSLASPSDRLSRMIVAGKPDESRLYEVTRPGANGDRPEMPEKGAPLTDEERSHLREWIAAGAIWPEGVVLREASKVDGSWWAYQPLRGETPPSMPHDPAAAALENPIDAFLRAKLAEKNLTMNPHADRRTLIRRATYDLTGLPPSPRDVETFVNDPNPRAYEELLDRLLASPRYGERWGTALAGCRALRRKHWLRTQ